ncbi:MAG: ribosome recycling factor [Erysipelothrix sp.]|nr:ribosome recycling factor [Erysipelothrix sp.]
MHYSLAEEKMNGSIKSLNNELMKVRTGRANTSLLDEINVEYYGSLTPLNQIAGLSVVEGTQIIIKPYDANSLRDIEQAIHKSDIGFTPINDGTVVRVNIPALTEDTRKTIVKDVEKLGESTKVVIRNIRRDANNDITKDEDLSEDEVFNEQKRIQDLTDAFVAKIDAIIKDKSAEVMTI